MNDELQMTKYKQRTECSGNCGVRPTHKRTSGEQGDKWQTTNKRNQVTYIQQTTWNEYYK